MLRANLKAHWPLWLQSVDALTGPSRDHGIKGCGPRQRLDSRGGSGHCRGELQGQQRLLLQVEFLPQGGWNLPSEGNAWQGKFLDRLLLAVSTRVEMVCSDENLAVISGARPSQRAAGGHQARLQPCLASGSDLTEEKGYNFQGS
jgi:hypothetical protein